MEDRDFEREHRWRDRDRERSDRDWDRGVDRSRDLMMHPEYYDRNRDPGLDRSGYSRIDPRDWDYDRGYGQNWRDAPDWETGPTWTYVEYWWIVPGPYAGIGPRGYQRSDERIKEDISERLTQHGQIDASDIDISVENGELTFTGTVNSRREKRLAEFLADSVTGVQDVHNQLRLQKGEQGRAGMRGQVQVGMEVVGRDGAHIGQIKRVRDKDFLVDRSMARDVYVPFSACISTAGRIMLNVRADEIDNQGWKQPEIIETPGR